MNPTAQLAMIFIITVTDTEGGGHRPLVPDVTILTEQYSGCLQI